VFITDKSIKKNLIIFSKKVDNSFINPKKSISILIDKLEKYDFKKIENIHEYNEIKNNNTDGYKNYKDFVRINQIEVENQNILLKIIYRLDNISFDSFLYEIKYQIQKKKNGYSDRDLYNLDIYLTYNLGNQLKRLSKINQSYPPTYKNITSYRKALIKASENLIALKTGSKKTIELNNKYEKLIETNPKSKNVNLLIKKIYKSEQSDINKAKISLHWVADNLEHLWD